MNILRRLRSIAVSFERVDLDTVDAAERARAYVGLKCCMKLCEISLLLHHKNSLAPAFGFQKNWIKKFTLFSRIFSHLIWLQRHDRNARKSLSEASWETTKIISARLKLWIKLVVAHTHQMEMWHNPIPAIRITPTRRSTIDLRGPRWLLRGEQQQK